MTGSSIVTGDGHERLIHEDPADLRRRIEELTGRRVDEAPRVVEDTSEFVRFRAGTVLRLSGNDYLVLRAAREGRFGIDDQPKFWVKHVVDLADGSRKVVKLVFDERFARQIGGLHVEFRRDTEKESRVLELVSGDARFMQGRSVRDSVGNNVRILEHITGPSLLDHIGALDQPHERYFHETLPGILHRLVGCLEGLGFLRAHAEQHGDVRNDHVLVERDTGRYRWIDFDYSVSHPDYDVLCAGNVLNFVVGQGIVTWRDALAMRVGRLERAPHVEPGDALLLYGYRLANLRKVFPYISVELGEILMRFSASSDRPYSDFDEMIRDLKDAIR